MNFVEASIEPHTFIECHGAEGEENRIAGLIHENAQAHLQEIRAQHQGIRAVAPAVCSDAVTYRYLDAQEKLSTAQLRIAQFEDTESITLIKDERFDSPVAHIFPRQQDGVRPPIVVTDRDFMSTPADNEGSQQEIADIQAIVQAITHRQEFVDSGDVAVVAGTNEAEETPSVRIPMEYFMQYGGSNAGPCPRISLRAFRKKELHDARHAYLRIYTNAQD